MHPYQEYTANLPTPLRNRVDLVGDSAQEWVERLPLVVEHLAGKWGFEPGEVLTGGSEALILRVRLHDGDDAVVKVGLPGVCHCATEAVVLRMAAHTSYVELYAFDADENALLLEPLGDSLASANLSCDASIQMLCEAMARAWIPVDEKAGLATGSTKAGWLAEFIERTWRELPQSCEEQTIECALAFCREREAAGASAATCLVHADAHDHNALFTPGNEEIKLIDPDGLVAEPACDLAVPMRHWSRELLEGDPVTLLAARCRKIADLTGVDERAIWQWGFMERVSTGLHMTELKLTAEGKEMLRVADACAQTMV